MTIIGAGPAGMAVSACLRDRDVDHLLLEREEWVGSSWRSHYDRLHLHTTRRYSGLPGLPMPDSYPRYPSRDEFVTYLESYAHVRGLQPFLGVEVTEATRNGSCWRLRTSRGSLESDVVVLATGRNGIPVRPTWPGLGSFPGPILHSSEYRSGRPFEGREVLVVGFGNSGAEIALDLAECGARVSVVVRSPINIVPRDLFGLPLQTTAIALSHLPPTLADALSWASLKLRYPSYDRLGLQKAPTGPQRQVTSTGSVPVIDLGTIREIRRGKIHVFREVTRFEGPEVVLGGTRRRFDALVLATGFLPAELPGVEARTDRNAWHADADRSLYRCGFFVTSTGILREIGLEALRIVEAIS